MKNNCNIIKDLLAVYSIGECSEDTSMLVKEHLIHCDDCRAQLDAYNCEPEVTVIDEKKSFSDFSRSLKKRNLRKIIISTVLALAVLFGIGTLCWFPEFSISYDAALVEAQDAIDGGIDIIFAYPNYKESYAKFVRNDDGSVDVYITASNNLFTLMIPDADRSDNFLRIANNLCVSYKNDGQVMFFMPADSEIGHIYYTSITPSEFMSMDSEQLEACEDKVIIWE